MKPQQKACQDCQGPPGTDPVSGALGSRPDSLAAFSAATGSARNPLSKVQRPAEPPAEAPSGMWAGL